MWFVSCYPSALWCILTGASSTLHGWFPIYLWWCLQAFSAHHHGNQHPAGAELWHQYSGSIPLPPSLRQGERQHTHIPSLKRQVELLWSQLTHTRINIKCVFVCVCQSQKERPCRVACIECLCVCQVWPLCFSLRNLCVCVCVWPAVTGCCCLLLSDLFSFSAAELMRFNNVFFCVFLFAGRMAGFTNCSFCKEISFLSAHWQIIPLYSNIRTLIKRRPIN